MNIINLFDLNEYLRRVVALNFPEKIWVQCEISQSSISKGHLYLDVIQKDEILDEIIAQSRAVVWERQLRQLFQQHGKEIFNVLSDGKAVKILVRVSFHERYGMTLSVEDVDIDFTFGKLAQLRRKNLEILANSGLILLQRRLTLPKVIQKIAVLSAEKAAGWIDFRAHLNENRYGYKYHIDFFDIGVQGKAAAQNLTQQILSFGNSTIQSADYDAIVIVRGGGAKTDLFVFDDLELNKAVATCPIPILVGIGHEIDETVIDTVAHRSLKTPTAVADFLIEYNTNFEIEVLQCFEQIERLSKYILQENSLFINDLNQKVKLYANYQLQNEQQKLTFLSQQVRNNTNTLLHRATQEINGLSQLVESYHPKNILARGFSLTYQNGKILKDINALDSKLPIVTQLENGVFESEIKQ